MWKTLNKTFTLKSDGKVTKLTGKAFDKMDEAFEKFDGVFEEGILNDSFEFIKVYGESGEEVLKKSEEYTDKEYTLYTITEHLDKKKNNWYATLKKENTEDGKSK